MTTKYIRIVRGESKFAGSPNRELKLQPYLDATNRQLTEGDRNLVLNLRDQFDFERSYSTIYRLYGKIDVLYNNIISGTTQDTDFMGSMYFIPDYNWLSTNPRCSTIKLFRVTPSRHIFIYTTKKIWYICKVTRVGNPY